MLGKEEAQKGAWKPDTELGCGCCPTAPWTTSPGQEQAKLHGALPAQPELSELNHHPHRAYTTLGEVGERVDSAKEGE